MSNNNNDEFAITEKMANAVNSHLAKQGTQCRLIMLRTGLIFEIRNPKMRLTAKAPKCTTILRREFDITGNKLAQLATFETLLQMVEMIPQGDCSTVFDLDGKLRLMTREEKAQLDAQAA
jgi:hypothetical protein